MLTAFSTSLYRINPAVYHTWNWNAGFINIIIGCGILLEIYKHALPAYPGAERFARISGLVIFAVLFLSGIAYLIFVPSSSESRMTIARNLERNLLAVQAIFLSSLGRRDLLLRDCHREEISGA